MTQGPQADPARPALAQRRIMRACKIPMVGCTGIVLLALWSVVHNLVPNPLATAPGRSLAQIHQEVAAAGEPLEVAVVLGISGQGIALARATMRACWRRHRRDPRADAISFLLLGVLAAPAHWLASVGPGMALADTYLTTGAAHSPWGLPLYVASGLCLLGLPALLLRPPPCCSDPRARGSKGQLGGRSGWNG